LVALADVSLTSGASNQFRHPVRETPTADWDMNP